MEGAWQEEGTVEAWQGRGEGTVEGEGVRGRDRDMVVSRHTASTAGAERTEETAMAVILSRGWVVAVGLVALARAPMDTPLARQHTCMAPVVVSDDRVTRPRMDMVGLPARMVELPVLMVGPLASTAGLVARTAGLVGLLARTAGLVGLLARTAGLVGLLACICTAGLVGLLAHTVGLVGLLARTAGLVGLVASTVGLVGLVALTAGLVGLLARTVGLPVLIGLRPQTTTMAVLATIRALLSIIQ